MASNSAIFGQLASKKTIEVPMEVTLDVPVGKPDPETGKYKTRKETRQTVQVLLEWAFHLERRANREKAMRAADVRISKARFEDIDDKMDKLKPFLLEIMTQAGIECEIRPQASEDSKEASATVSGLNALLVAFGTELGTEVLVTGEVKNETMTVGTLKVFQDQESGATSGTSSEEVPADGEQGQPTSKGGESGGSGEGRSSGTRTNGIDAPSPASESV